MTKIDKTLVSRIALEIQEEWGAGGLAGTLYEDFAVCVLERYIEEKAETEGGQRMTEEQEIKAWADAIEIILQTDTYSMPRHELEHVIYKIWARGVKKGKRKAKNDGNIKENNK